MEERYTDDRFLVCPFCGMNRKLIKSGTNTEKIIDQIKPPSKLDVVDIETRPFIDHRDISGGRGSGFPRVSFETLAQVKDWPEYADLIEGLKRQCHAVLKLLGE